MAFYVEDTHHPADFCALTYPNIDHAIRPRSQPLQRLGLAPQSSFCQVALRVRSFFRTIFAVAAGISNPIPTEPPEGE
jgi:hypothetical protein